MADEKRRKKKPAKKKKPTDGTKTGLFGRKKKNPKQEHQAKTAKAENKQREATVTGNGQILQSKAALLGKVTAWVFVVFVAFGAVAAVINFVNPPATAEQVVETGESPESQQAADYGRAFVGAWLRATSEDDDEVSRYMPVSRGDITEEEATEYRDLAVASVETDDNDLSTVIVSAEVLTVVEEDEATEEDEEETDEEDEATEEDEEEVETEWVKTWYQVNVYHSEGTFTSLGWPAPISAPETGDTPQMAYQFDASDEVEGTVEAFFEAYILESGDVARLTHPDSTIQALGESPYTNVSIQEVTTDEDHRDAIPEDETVTNAYVELTLGTSEDTARAASYALTLETRGGRWEVRNLDPAPVINPDEIIAEPNEDSADAETDTSSDTD